MTRPKVYLAGPDVFAADAKALGAAKKRLCDQYGFDGLFPLDNEIDVEGDPAAARQAIFEANMAMIAQADLCVANVTPFKGIEADAGTAFEVGAAHVLKKRIFLYSAFDGDVAARHEALRAAVPADNAFFRFDDFDVEAFEAGVNLMLLEACAASGGVFLASSSGRIEDLDVFERVLARAAADLGLPASA